MKESRFSRWFIAATALGLLLAACGGGAATATPQPTAAPTRQPTATVQVVQPTAASTSPPAAAATPRPVPTATATTVPPTPTTPKEQPVYGGSLKRAEAQDPKNFDMVDGQTRSTQYMVAMTYEQLIRYNPRPDGCIDVRCLEPELAESWEIGNAGLTYTFHLRKDVKWSDGVPFTSADVVYFWNRMMKPPEGIRSGRAADFPHLKSVEAPDAYTVVFTFAYSRASTLISLADGRISVHSKHVAEEATKSDVAALKKDPKLVIGTGPFLYSSYEPDVKYCAKKNPNYWRKGTPYLDEICHMFIRDSNTRFVALATGQVHMVWLASTSLTYPQAEQAAKDFSSKIVIVPHLANRTTGVIWNSTKTPFSDVRVRQAMRLVIDLDEYMDVVMGPGKYSEGRRGDYLAPGSTWALPQEETRRLQKQDIVKAKSLLKEAGYEAGFSLTYNVWDSPQPRREAEYLADLWKKTLGITSRLELTDLTLSQQRTVRGNFDVASGGVGIGVDPNQTVYPSFHSKSPARNQSIPTDPEMDRLLDAQSIELDPAKRRDLVNAAGRRLYEYMPAYVAAYFSYNGGQTPQVGGFWPLDYGVYDQARFEHVWLKK